MNASKTQKISSPVYLGNYKSKGLATLLDFNHPAYPFARVRKSAVPHY